MYTKQHAPRILYRNKYQHAHKYSKRSQHVFRDSNKSSLELSAAT